MKKYIICTVLIAMFGVVGCKTDTGKDERSAGRTEDDKAITEKVRKSLEEEPVFKFGNVDVKTYGGDVQLSGFVNTNEQKDRAGQIATQTPGVARVYNDLALKPFAPTPTGNTNAPQQNTIYSSPPQQKPAQGTQPAAPEQKDEPK